MDITANIKKWSLTAIALFLCVSFTSCDSVIYEDEGDCTPYYHIKFKYDMNMKYADAFYNEVKSVGLYVFNTEGVLVHQQFESSSVLSDDDYYMPLEIQPGEYDLLAWCGLEGSESFRVPHAYVGVTTLEEMKCKMNYTVNGNEGSVTTDLSPLFHGLKRVVLLDEEGVHEETLSLTKNTNVVRVVLQHLSGNDVNPSLFRFEITDDNGLMNYDNTLIDNMLLRYSPWSVIAGNADIGSDIYGRATIDNVSVAVAEFTVGRLMTYRRPVLSIYNVEKGTRVLSIPLVDYALLVKGNYNRKMTDQEYLDRQDEYNLTFFLDEAGNWASAYIYINSWRVVLQNEDLQ